MLPRVLETEVMDSAAEARDYDAMDHREVNRLFAADFLAFAPPAALTGDILDVGAGTAQIPIELCRRAAALRIVALDQAAHMLALAQRNVVEAGCSDRIRLQRGDAKAMPFADGAFSAVISNSIVHHIPEPSHAVREMIRVLRPGGVLFIRDLLRPSTQDELQRLVHQYAGDANAHQRQMFVDSLHAALTIDEVRALATAAGLAAESVRQSSDRHWTWSAVKPEQTRA